MNAVPRDEAADDHDAQRDRDDGPGGPERRAASTVARANSSAADDDVDDRQQRRGSSGEPISGITKNGSTNVATIAPVVFTASRAPDDDPSVPVSSPSSAAVAGNVKPITIVGGRTMIAVDHAKSRSASANFADCAVDERVRRRREDERRPTTTNAAVSSWATAIRPIDGLDARPDEAEQDRRRSRCRSGTGPG